MANTRQARKRIKQALRRTQVNRARTSRIRTFIRQVEAAIESGDGKTAAKALKQAQPEVMRGVSRGVLHRKTASRRISRLAKRVKAVGA
ncbi:MAG: 30S ribosomal protein S20 [Rhodobacteraceae bacterium]|nr:30S ribosomal protein S20 [Paracoccaceae bacterium]MCY4196040.1 30S ribosomal protein S20 [Paracoccaceae bacterium]